MQYNNGKLTVVKCSNFMTIIEFIAFSKLQIVQHKPIYQNFKYNKNYGSESILSNFWKELLIFQPYIVLHQNEIIQNY